MFQFNVKGTTQLGGGLVVTGLITATADGTASKLFTQTITFVASSPQNMCLPIVNSDFERLTPIQVTNNEVIRLFAVNDEITLLLTFVPDSTALIPGLLANGEYVRDSATVNIIDNDCKYIHV